MVYTSLDHNSTTPTAFRPCTAEPRDYTSGVCSIYPKLPKCGSGFIRSECKPCDDAKCAGNECRTGECGGEKNDYKCNFLPTCPRLHS